MADGPQGRGMGAFFEAATPRRSPPTAPAAPPRVRTTISLPAAEAEWLDLLRMRLRQREGRGLTYGAVIATALRRLARDEGLTDAR
jgi:hypothetical protein